MHTTTIWTQYFLLDYYCISKSDSLVTFRCLTSLLFPRLYGKEFDRICNICIMNWYIAGTRNIVFSKSSATRGSRSNLCKNVISYFCESAANDNIKGSLISTFHVSQPGQTLLQSGIFRKSTLATIRGNNERESLEGTFVLPVSFVILFPTLFDQVL